MYQQHRFALWESETRCSLKTAAVGRFDYCVRKNRNRSDFSVTTVEGAQICFSGMKFWEVGRRGGGGADGGQGVEAI